MSGVTYGHDSAANGSNEYLLQQPVSYVTAQGQQVPYPGMAPQPLGQQRTMQQQEVQQQQQQQQQHQQHPLVQQTFMPGVGEPSMRKSVEGIPQVHMQQQQLGAQMLPTGMPMAAGQMSVLSHQQYAMPNGQAYAGIPMQYYAAAQQAQPFPNMQATHVADYRFGAPQFMVEPQWHGPNEWEEEFDENGGPMPYGNLEVKHRRRTTPEQLRVLEHWFSINPRPDNALREWLASELGITKRNVQVWFQNRRAKIKNQEKAREAAEKEAAKQNGTASGQDANTQNAGAGAPSTSQSNGPATDLTDLSSHPVTTPSQPIAGHQASSSQPPSANSTPTRPTSSGGAKQTNPVLLSHADKLNMGRRVSLVGGDVASIEHWAIKRRQQMGHAPLQPTAPGNSPMGLAAAARRNSQPYPTQIITQTGGEDQAAAAAASVSRSALPSPKISPNGRMPSALLFTAMRNNTIRRASMPGGAQLISTTAFTPPRISSYNHPINGTMGQQRELSPIKDQDADIDPALRNMSFGQSDTSYLSVPDPSSSLSFSLNPGLPFSPNSPLPNPTFSFGGTPTDAPSLEQLDPSGRSTPTTNDPQHALFLALQRDRLGSIASVNSTGTTATDATATTTTADGSDNGDWASFIPPGFDPDVRRASAPADLLHNIGMLGISGSSTQMRTSMSASLARPSPLAAGYSQSQPNVNTDAHANMDQAYGAASILAGGPYLPATDSSPLSASVASEGPSPSSTNPNQKLMPPPPIPQLRQNPSIYTFDSQYDYDSLPNLTMGDSSSSSTSLPSLPEPSPSAHTFPDGASGDYDLPSSSLDLGFDLDAKDQYAFLSELDEANVLV